MIATEYHDLENDGIGGIAQLLSVEQLREVLTLTKKQTSGRISSMNREYPNSSHHSSSSRTSVTLFTKVSLTAR